MKVDGVTVIFTVNMGLVRYIVGVGWSVEPLVTTFCGMPLSLYPDCTMTKHPSRGVDGNENQMAGLFVESDTMV